MLMLQLKAPRVSKRIEKKSICALEYSYGDDRICEASLDESEIIGE